MKFEYFHYQLNLKSPFRIASGERNHTDIVLVKLSYKDFIGYGEASLPPYFKENVQSVFSFFKKIDQSKLKIELSINEFLEYVDGIDKGNNAAKAAIDIAIHDLKGKIENKAIYELYGIKRPKNIYTSLTIGISSLKELEQKLESSSEIKMFKLKLGGIKDKELIQDYLSICDKPFCVDVNQGWSNKEKALDMVSWLNAKGAKFIEQPFKVDNLKGVSWLYKRSPLPLIADESVRRLNDMHKMENHFHGINVKLMKSTGIYEAIQMIKIAKTLDLKVLIGCMAESSCSVAAAWHLSALADWADLDAPLLSSNDLFTGIKYINGKIDVEVGSGLGVFLNENL